MNSAAFKRGAAYYLEGRPIAWGINYFKDEPLAMEEWLLGWCSEALKDYRDISDPDDPFVWIKQKQIAREARQTESPDFLDATEHLGSRPHFS